MNDSTTHLLYSSCIPVRGSKYNIVCDLQRNSYVRIPDGLYEILSLHRGKSDQTIKHIYDNKYDEIIDEYFGILVSNELAFSTHHPEHFPELSSDWHMPFEIFNSIVDWSESSTYDVFEVINQLSALNCKFLQIRFFDAISLDFLVKIIDYFEIIGSSSIGLELLVRSSEEINYDVTKKILNKYKRINKIILHGVHEKFSIEETSPYNVLIKTPAIIESESHCGVVDPSLFTINIKSFTESKKYNSCLNGKVSIDHQGFIKNCPSMKTSYGHLSDKSISDAVMDKNFKDVWKITKDDIEVCRDCEYRYICTDCRAHTQDGRTKSKPAKCTYDPYTGVWE